MLYKINISLIIFIMFVSDIHCQDYHIEKIKGGYQYLTLYRYLYKNGELDSNSKFKHIFHKFNKDGNYVEKVFFNNDLPTEKYTKIFDKDGKEIEEDIFSPIDLIYIKSYSKYNDFGKIKETICYNANNSIKETISYFYDGNKNVIKIIDFDGESFSKTIYKYNKNNKVIKIVEYDSKNSIDTKTLYNYDRKDNLIEETIYYKSGPTEVKYIYKYNNFNQKIESIHYFDKKTSFRDFYKYDEKGNMIEEISLNADNTQFSRVTIKYDIDGYEIENIFYDNNDVPKSRTEFIYSK